ncbi:MAG TPA: hypothetical protein VG435_17425 [Acidimicrobiales bacterium]|jgi:hypothetical protein|nr:hypothetical protein [Acidimicrobiales bacterium]
MAFANSAKAQAKQKKEQARAQVKEKFRKSVSDSDDSEALKNLTPRQVDKVVTQALPGAMAASSSSSEPSAPAPVSDEQAPTPAPEKPAAKPKPDIDGAANALFRAGEMHVPSRQKDKREFLAEYHLTAQDVAAVEKTLNELRAAAKAAKPAAPVYDLSDPAQRPTSGGMSEDDAATVARLNGWRVDDTEWKCSDVNHTPKGRVYTDGKSYFGADNTGHVGWGFKVWTPKKKGVLDYAGNTVWDGPTQKWKYIKRG